MVPFYSARLDDTLPRGVTGLTRSIGQTYRDQVFVTPSGILSTPHFLFVRAVLGTGRIMMSIDYPYLTLTGARAWLEGLPIGEDERVAVAHATADRLVGLTAHRRT